MVRYTAGVVNSVNPEDVMPLMIDVGVFNNAKANTNYGNITVGASYLHNAYKQGAGAQNQACSWDVVLARGTWTCKLIHTKGTDQGIYSVQIDGVTEGTIDGYTGSTTYNQVSSVTGIVIPSERTVQLQLKMATKNASSSNYHGNLDGVQLVRVSTAI